jgi:hypothetical protein
MSRYKFKNRKFPREFKKVVEYIQKTKGVTVLLGHDTLFNGHFSREIIIHHNFDLNGNGLYALLRGCGEVYQPPITPFTTLYEKYIRELEAWERGLQIARELKLKIDESKYKEEQGRVFTEKFIKIKSENH